MVQKCPPYPVVLFDLDGTLLDTLMDLHDALNETLTRFGLPTRSPDEVRRFLGNGVEKLLERSIDGGRTHPLFADCLAFFKPAYAARSQVHTRPYDGIPALLARLHENGVRIGVVSNKFDEAVRSLCAHYFGDVIGCAVGKRDGIRPKPFPDTVLAAAARLGACVSDCLYVGDSEVDIETANEAGIPCLSVTWGFRDEDFLLAHGAVRLAHTVREAEAFLFGTA